MNYSFLIIYLFISTIFINPRITSGDKSIAKKDSTEIWINYSKDTNFNLEVRKAYLKKAYESILLEKNDSLRNNYLLKISYRYYKLNDSLSFRTINKESIALSEKLQDSISWAANYWDLGRFYSKKGVKDSAFYAYSKAQKIYSGLKNDDFAGRMLLSMAIMQSDVKDFTGSEINTIKAITILKPLKKYPQLYRCYNNLAINFNNLEEYDKAIENHKIALEYQKQIKTNNTFKENSLNNIGVVYRNLNNHHEAIVNYNHALATIDLKKRNVKLYAMLLDNMAYSKFKLNILLKTKEQLYESLKLRDSINDYMGIAVNKLHLAEYYIFIKDSIKSKQYALETSELARNTKNYRELFSSLLMLSKLDKKNSPLYINEYIKLNDSLQKQERITRNKFTRIQFQTDEFITRNKRLNKQNNTILLISGLSLLIGTLLYIIRNQRARNKTLLFEKEQQKANEEIYNLMIVQQEKLDEGSKIAKKRISEELHDGVLGKLFGTRLILANLNNNSDEETVLKREKYIKDLQEIEEEIRNVSHELNNQSLLSNSNVGYTKILEKLIEDQSKITYFNFNFKSDKAIRWEEKEGSLKINLYRIIQEAIQNINKHAQAKHVSVEFKTNEKELILFIKDDGLGFNTSATNKGIGLRNITSRVKKFNGKVDIISSINNGTSLKITIPNN